MKKKEFYFYDAFGKRNFKVESRIEVPLKFFWNAILYTFWTLFIIPILIIDKIFGRKDE